METKNKDISILIVDDEIVEFMGIKRIIETKGYSDRTEEGA